ncbi:MAG: hypothetical protein Kow0068_09220 [Marinilabiliales bacterium]
MRQIIITILINISFYYIAFSQNNTYIVLTTVSDTTNSYYQAAKTLSLYRNAQIYQIDTGNFTGILSTLMSAQPRYVAIVLKPDELDINFVRKFLMTSTQLDSDPFTDFSYGYITGATGQNALNFVDTIIYAEQNNIEDFPLNISGFAASSLNYIYYAPGDYMIYLNPNNYSQIYLETNDNGSGVNYFNANTTYLENNKILDIGYNGDPHMIWLFEGGNTNPTPPVWNYNPALIEDPAYARVGISSYEIDSLNLYPAVVFNGACHSGEPKKVLVEGDIAATFGDVQGFAKFYTMSDTFSFCLTILKTGITGYFAPCGANNANDQGEEVYNAFLYHEPLGDIHKRSMDGVVMGFFGNPVNLKTYHQGDWTYGCDVLTSGTFDPNNWSGACYMLGGKANRIYFGDPIYNPFQNNHDSQLEIVTANIDSIDQNTMDITLAMNKPSSVYFPVWDKFHFSNTRIYLPVTLPSYVDDVIGFSVIDSSGPYDTAFYAMEYFDGNKILHLETDIPDDMYDAINYSIKFRINYTNLMNNDISDSNNSITIYPNPANKYVILQGIIPKSTELYDIAGKIIKKYDNEIVLDISDVHAGIYYLSIKSEKHYYKKLIIQ